MNSDKLAAAAGYRIQKEAFSGVGIMYRSTEEIQKNIVRKPEKIALSLRKCIDKRRVERKALKIQLVINASFYKFVDPERKTCPPTSFISKMTPLYSGDNVLMVMKRLFQQAWSKLERYEKNGSGWTLDRIIYVEWHLWEFELPANKHLISKTEAAKQKREKRLKKKADAAERAKWLALVDDTQWMKGVEVD